MSGGLGTLSFFALTASLPHRVWPRLALFPSIRLVEDGLHSHHRFSATAARDAMPVRAPRYALAAFAVHRVAQPNDFYWRWFRHLLLLVARGFHPHRRRARLCPISTRIGAVRVGLPWLPFVAASRMLCCSRGWWPKARRAKGALGHCNLTVPDYAPLGIPLLLLSSWAAAGRA